MSRQPSSHISTKASHYRTSEYLLRAHSFVRGRRPIDFCLESAPALAGLVQWDNALSLDAGAISKTLKRLASPHTCLDLPPQSASQLSTDPRGYVKRNPSVSPFSFDVSSKRPAIRGLDALSIPG